MSVNKTDVVGEYLREIELRLSGLPVLQRHELLADLREHIDAARERGAYSEGEIIEVLERLGSPEVVAAAAYREAGPPLVMPPPEPPRAAPPAPSSGPNVWAWVLAAAGGFAVLLLIGIAWLVLFARTGGESAPMPATTTDIVEPMPYQTS